MPDDSQLEIEALAGEIARYLAAHPKAADTVEGITKWWLTRQRYEESMVKVQKALDRLVEDELISRVGGDTGRAIYAKRNNL